MIQNIHRVHASKSYVSGFDKTVNTECDLCNVKNDICHVFYYCKHVKEFWASFEQWLQLLSFPVNASLKNVLFGVLEPISLIQNFCLLHAKCFLHREYSKTKDDFSYRPSLLSFQMYLKFALKVEKQIAVSSDSLNTFEESIGQIQL